MDGGRAAVRLVQFARCAMAGFAPDSLLPASYLPELPRLNSKHFQEGQQPGCSIDVID
jgi:hypothetical protein